VGLLIAAATDPTTAVEVGCACFFVGFLLGRFVRWR
jgi:hypothetical protein